MKTNKIILLFLFMLTGSGLKAQLPKQIYVKEAGTLKTQLTENEIHDLTELTLTGNINAKDFKLMRDELINLKTLDLSAASIRMYIGKEGTFPDAIYVYPKDCIPAYAFKGNPTLEKIILSPYTRNLEDCSFQDCSNLRILQIKKQKAPNLLPHALDSITTAIFIPLGSKDEYRSKEKWAGFNFVEGEPVEISAQISQPGTLENEIQKSGNRPEEIKILTLSGELNEEDFKFIQNRMINLVSIDITKCASRTIPAFAFSQKKHLMWVKFPQQLETIGDRAFSGCVWLSGEILLPSTIQEIGYGAFLGCDRLSKIKRDEGKPAKLGENIFGPNSKAVLE